jgi:hypothetical protein
MDLRVGRSGLDASGSGYGSVRDLLNTTVNLRIS